MVCDLCKDGEAVIQLTEIEGSGVRQLHLCEKCAAERGVETTITAAKPQINNFLQTIHEQMAGVKGEPTQCSFCSATLADFRATGRLGCAHCYDTFESSLRDRHEFAWPETWKATRLRPARATARGCGS